MYERIKKEEVIKRPEVNGIYEKYIKYNITIHPDAKAYVFLALLECAKDYYAQGYESGKKVERIRHSNWLNSNIAEIMRKYQNGEIIEVP